MVSELSTALEILGLGFWLLTVLNDVSQCLINSYKVDDVAMLDHSVFTGLALHLLGSLFPSRWTLMFLREWSLWVEEILSQTLFT